MKEKIVSLVSKVKERKIAVSALLMALLFSFMVTGTCFASESGGGNVSDAMKTSMTTAFNGVKADVLAIITTALPPALAIMGVIIAVMVGIKFFRRAAK